MEAAGEGDAAAFGGGWGGVPEFVAKEGDGVEDFVEAEVGMAGHDGDADFVGRGGGDVSLAEVAPVNFDVGTPGLDAEMCAEAETAAAEVGGVEVGPCADAGGLAVGSDQPAVVDRLVGEGGGLVWFEDDRGVPGEAHAEFGGAVEEQAVQAGAAEAYSCCCFSGIGCEVGGDAGLTCGEGYAGEGGAVVGFEGDAELGEGVTRVGHDAFAAGLVDGGPLGVGDEYVRAAKAKADGGGETGGAGSGNEYVTSVVTHF